ncbi:MAG TPA: hypothetical protein VJ654_08260 [Noviherbaspirillum sp.]|nr:hypothetical protein [Noviherbaspirillum sp.]
MPEQLYYYVCARQQSAAALCALIAGVIIAFQQTDCKDGGDGGQIPSYPSNMAAHPAYFAVRSGVIEVDESPSSGR